MQGGFLQQYEAALGENPAAAVVQAHGWMRTRWRAFFAELREHRPVFVTPAFTVVTTFADVREVLSLERVFSVRAFGPRLEAALGGPFMLSRDATPVNWREKGLMQAMLRPEDAEAVRELAGRAADEALDAAAQRGRIEAVHELFRHVALRVCAGYFGIPGPTPARLGAWTRAIIVDGFANYLGDPDLRAAGEQAGADLLDYLRGVLKERRAAIAAAEGPPPQDIVARLIRTRLPDELGVDDDRLIVNLAGLPLGWVESGPGAMAEAVEQLLLRPGVLAEAVEAAKEPDPSRFDPYVWEALRFSPFFKLLPRVCEQDHVLAAGTPRQTRIPAGTFVLAAPCSAMFDAGAVESPEEFRVARPHHERLFFGMGHHACLGADPAAAVVCEVVRRLLRRGVASLPSPEGDPVRLAHTFPDSYQLALRTEAR
ncbi:cytochrome P450 [Nonomuraea soli]